MRSISRFLGLLTFVGLLGLMNACGSSDQAQTGNSREGPPEDNVARRHLKEVPDTLKVYTLRVQRFEDRVSRGLCALTRIVLDSMGGADYGEVPDGGSDWVSWRFCRPDSESPEYPPPPDPIEDPWGNTWPPGGP